jgi:HEAT repeat protein
MFLNWRQQRLPRGDRQQGTSVSFEIPRKFQREMLSRRPKTGIRPPAIERYCRLLWAKGTEERRYAAWVLSQVNEARAVELLIEALGDTDPTLRIAAVEALEGLGEPKWGQWVKGDWMDFARLGASREPQAVRPLTKALDHWAICRAAIQALGQLGGVCAIDALLEKLGDDREAVRIAAVEALGQLGQAQVFEPLNQLLADDSSQVRAAVVGALGKMGGKVAVESLIQSLCDKSSNVRQAAALALDHLANTHALEPLIKTIDGKLDEKRLRVVTHLARFAFTTAGAVNIQSQIAVPRATPRGKESPLVSLPA